MHGPRNSARRFTPQRGTGGAAFLAALGLLGGFAVTLVLAFATKHAGAADLPPSATVIRINPTATEGTPFTFGVLLAQPITPGVTCSVITTTTGLTATEGTDFASKDGITINLTSTNNRVDITVDTIDDTNDEPDETLVFGIDLAPGETDCTLASPVADVTIQDNDEATPVLPQTLYPTSVVPPSSVAIGATYAVETAQRVNVTCAGTIAKVWWYRTLQDTGTNTVTIWNASGTTLASASSNPGATGWVSVALPSPLAVSANTQLVIGVHHPNGAYARRLNGFTNRTVNGPGACLNSPASATGAGNGLYLYTPTPALPSASHEGTEYFISPELLPGGPPPPPPPPPPSNARLYATTVTPASSVNLGSAHPVTTAQRINFTCSGLVNGVWWYKTPTDTGTQTIAAWRGTTLLQTASGSPAGSGWVYVAFSTPIPVTNGDALMLAVHHPNGSYARELDGFTARTVTAGCLSSPANTPTAPNGLYKYGATITQPSVSHQGTEYFVGPDFTQTIPSGP